MNIYIYVCKQVQTRSLTFYNLFFEYTYTYKPISTHIQAHTLTHTRTRTNLHIRKKNTGENSSAM